LQACKAGINLAQGKAQRHPGAVEGQSSSIKVVFALFVSLVSFVLRNSGPVQRWAWIFLYRSFTGQSRPIQVDKGSLDTT